MNHNIITQKRKGIMLRFFAGRKMRFISMTVLMSMLFQLGYPTAAWALTGGPSQPEVESFEPVGTSEMVDLFSGDFNYNIPLLDVDGYPINIAYHSGVTTDQEASWVGLGWNINCGSVNRGLRGLPDDFNGDKIHTVTNIKEQKSWGVSAGYSANFELFGADVPNPDADSESILNIGGNVSLGIQYHNYNGYSASFSLTPSIGAGEKSKMPLNLSLGISGNSSEGASIQPTVSMSFNYYEKTNKSGTTTTTGSLKLSFGGAFNTRKGMTTLSISASNSFLKKETSTFLKAMKSIYLRESAYKKSGGSFGQMSAAWNVGMPTYTPTAGNHFRSLGFSGKFSAGLGVIGLYQSGSLQGFTSRNYLENHTRDVPSYGYLHNHEALPNESLMDFNRENDGGFNEFTPTIAMPIPGYDLFSVSGQGVGGSYRAYRSEIGAYSDPKVEGRPSPNFNIEVELGFGVGAHVGGAIGITQANSESSRWYADNEIAEVTAFKGQQEGNLLYEPAYFKEANELSIDEESSILNQNGGYGPVMVALDDLGNHNVHSSTKWIRSNSTQQDIQNVSRTKRQKRTQVFSFLTNQEAKDFGIQKLSTYQNSQSHHIGEIINTSADGSRYVYGLALKNDFQKEVTFAVGTTFNENGSENQPDFSHSYGMVEYNVGENSTENTRGLDHYYSCTTTPEYAHSYMLTSILSSDYVDTENQTDELIGPSDGDIGSWTKFHYLTVNDYKWRTPIGENLANFSQGLLRDYTDDKASYVYGQKDVSYLEKIESKNYIALFVMGERFDALGVADENGEINEDNKLKYLKKIMLYSKAEYLSEDGDTTQLTPIKSVHFQYDYLLCPGAGNNANGENGKLTLTKLFFTYGNSNKARFSSYEFVYSDEGSNENITSDENPSYNLKGYDRWGTYKPNPVGQSYNIISNISTNSEDPYAPRDRELANRYSSAWSLRKVKLPSGGEISIEYESDEYSHVQDKPAMEMLDIIGSSISSPNLSSSASDAINISDQDNNNCRIYFRLREDDNGQPITDISNYFSGISSVFIKALHQFKEFGNGPQDGAFYYEYVPGYYEMDTDSDDPAFGIESVNNELVGFVRLKPVKLKDASNNSVYNPITRSGIQFLRLNHSSMLFNHSNPDNSNFKNILISVADAFGTFKEFFKNPNTILYNEHEIGQNIMPFKSKIRLNCATGKKNGGGSRVKAIRISDNWADMSGEAGGHQGTDMSYGQEYIYTTTDGKTSGVASYEPQIGGEENPWKQPIYYTQELKGVPDDRFFKEEPIGESFFPNPSVGYSRVIVRNLPRPDVEARGTGAVVHEFYTNKDFPTIALRNELFHIRHKPNEIASLLNFTTNDHSTVTQGFYVELNDMCGKPKSQKVYSEYQDYQSSETIPLSSVEYFYKSEAYGNGSRRLRNEVHAIKKNGALINAEVGVHMEILNDFREQKTDNWGANVSGNVDMVVLPFLAFPVPAVWPNFNRDKTQFRSVATTKVVQRFGVLDSTVATQNGSSVSTRNLAYDAETGQVLLTSTQTNFEDPIYTLNLPAYWKYEEMGPAYQNIGLAVNMGFDAEGEFNFFNADNYFQEGDELALTGGVLPNGSVSPAKKGWVVEVNSNRIKVIDQSGYPIVGANYHGKVIRSGYRNMQMGMMASIASRTNPLNDIYGLGNNYSLVLQASAVEYSQNWRTSCDCFDETNATTNPYVLGILGYWKPSKSYTYLTSRNQGDVNNNTNLRDDGFYEGFNPFYYLDNSGHWNIDYSNWTYTSEITEFSPFGMELENRDALGRYSSERFGYNQTFPVAVAANSKYSQMGFEGFEFLESLTCADNDFDLNIPGGSLVEDDAHTGSFSVRISQASTSTMHGRVPLSCDPSACSLLLSDLVIIDSGNYSISALNSQGGCTISWIVLNGDPIIDLTNDDTISVSGAGSVIQVFVSDASGYTVDRIYQIN